ncbi:MAG: hypothetical protein GF398_13910 [Chitinivibrionales bacterium]|nr:hypothetical protein [Chitinivibrionales bacterium]
MRKSTLHSFLLFAVPATFLMSACAAQNCGMSDHRKHCVPESVFVEAYAAFAFDAMSSIFEDYRENAVVSPVSIALSLALAGAGAQGVTQREIRAALHLEEYAAGKTRKNWAAICQSLRSQKGVHTATSLWYRKDIQIHDQFSHTLSDIFAGDAYRSNFADPALTDTINAWVGRQTNSMIDRILSGPVDESALVYLINALYFNGKWQNAFVKDDSYAGGFHIRPDSTVACTLMYQMGMHDIAQLASCRLLRRGYGNVDADMVLILPERGRTCAEALDEISDSNFAALDSGFSTRQGDIHLPKFTLSHRTELTEALQALGITSAFTSLANFSAISDATPLFISKILHTAKIAVDEAGTVAAAATLIELSEEERLPLFKCDRPFLFLIIDRSKDMILFAGYVANPAA